MVPVVEEGAKGAYSPVSRAIYPPQTPPRPHLGQSSHTNSSLNISPKLPWTGLPRALIKRTCENISWGVYQEEINDNWLSNLKLFMGCLIRLLREINASHGKITHIMQSTSYRMHLWHGICSIIMITFADVNPGLQR